MNALSRRTVSSYAFQDDVEVIPSLDSATSTVFTQHRVIVKTHTSVWMQHLASRFDEIVSLAKGWDGYSAVPVAFGTAEFAAQMIERLCISEVPVPSIIPGSDGSLQVEWHAGGFDIELDVQGPNEVEAYRLNQATGATDELELESDFSQIASWLTELSIARSAANKNCIAG